MDITYQELIEKLKKAPSFEDEFLEKIKYNKDGTRKSKKEIDNILKLFNILTNDSSKIDEEKIKKNIIMEKEIIKDNVSFGIVILKKSIPQPIEYTIDNQAKMKNKTKYDAKLIIIDNKYEIDNLLLKRFTTVKAANNYANKLIALVNDNTLDEIANFIDKSINM